MLTSAELSVEAPDMYQWPSSWDVPMSFKLTPGCDIDAMAAALLDVSVLRRSKVLPILRNIVADQGRDAALKACRRFEKSYSIRLSAVARSYRRKIGSFADAYFCELPDLIANSFRLGSLRGSATVFTVPRKDAKGEWYELTAPGLLRFATALILEDIAEVLAPLDGLLTHVMLDSDDG